MERKPLLTYTRFWDAICRGDYRGPTTDIERPDRFPNDKDFVEFVKREAIKICGPYLEKEEEAKITSLGSWKRINRVFNLMGVAYEDRPVLAEQKDKVAERVKGKKFALVKGKKPIKAKGQRPIAWKRKASEPNDVRLGHELAKPFKKSVKFTLGGLDRGSGLAEEERVHEDF